MIVSQGSIFLENDAHSTYEFEISNNTNNSLGNLEIEINDTVDFSIQKVDWTYSISAEEVEYLSEGETFQENYNIQLSENFVNFVQDDVASLDINIDVVGTDDQTEIIFEDVNDVDILLREGKDFNASGEVLVSERDSSDELAISLQFPQTVIRDDLGQTSDSLVDIPIEFTIKSADTEQQFGILVLRKLFQVKENLQHMKYKGRNFLLVIISWSGLSLIHKMFLIVCRQGLSWIQIM